RTVKNARSTWLVVRFSKSGEPTTRRAFRCLHPADALITSETRQRAVWQLWLAEYLCFGSVAVAFISEMLPNMESIWPVIVRCDLDGKPDAIANVLNECVSCPIIALSHLVRKDQLCVSVNAAP